jgi:hypothetical protein
LAVLLRRPDTEFHVLDLTRAVHQPSEMLGEPAQRGGSKPLDLLGGGAGPMADARARKDYQRRIEELRDEVSEAERFHDIGRLPKLHAELAQITQELRRSYGFGRRPRVAASASERARINVRNNISNALTILKRLDEPLWRHLNSAVRTGTFCSYQPERRIPWAF